MLYPPIPLASTSASSKNKLQQVQNQALRFANNETFPYTKDTKIMHDETKIEPINYHLYTQAHKIFEKMTNLQSLHFLNIIDNYEIHKNHPWFQRTTIILDRGPPIKKYTS